MILNIESTDRIFRTVQYKGEKLQHIVAEIEFEQWWESDIRYIYGSSR